MDVDDVLSAIRHYLETDPMEEEGLVPDAVHRLVAESYQMVLGPAAPQDQETTIAAQEALQIQEPAAPQAQEATIAATQEALQIQELAAPQAHESIAAAQGMLFETEEDDWVTKEVSQSWLAEIAEFLKSEAPQAQEGTIAAAQEALQIQEPAAPQTQEAIAAAQGIAVEESQEQPQQQGLVFAEHYAPRDVPPLPVHQQHLIDGDQYRGPFEKLLSISAAKHKSSELKIKQKHVREFLQPILNAKESRDLSEGTYIPVTVYDTNGVEYPMRFRFRDTGNSYYFTGDGWSSFREDHGLEGNREVLIFWVFRNVQTHNLCFVITSRRQPG